MITKIRKLKWEIQCLSIFFKLLERTDRRTQFTFWKLMKYSDQELKKPEFLKDIYTKYIEFQPEILKTVEHHSFSIDGIHFMLVNGYTDMLADDAYHFTIWELSKQILENESEPIVNKTLIYKIKNKLKSLNTELTQLTALLPQNLKPKGVANRG